MDEASPPTAVGGRRAVATEQLIRAANHNHQDHPTVTRVWADQGFAGRLVQWAADTLHRELTLVRKQPKPVSHSSG
jgi:hypothetical protein